MHDSVKVTFNKFIENYLNPNRSLRVLEIGSLNVNGGLRDLKPDNFNWVGMDLVEGPGVDKVIDIGSTYPFENHTFDLVVASSVFEHDIEFWSTFLEMCRVVKPDGITLLIMPSQGTFHRYPLDAFRFYPDAGMALEKWANRNELQIKLIESFTTRPTQDVWADFVAIFSGRALKVEEVTLVGSELSGENWIVDGDLIQDTYQELPIEIRRIRELENRISELEKVKGLNEKPYDPLKTKFGKARTRFGIRRRK